MKAIFTLLLYPAAIIGIGVVAAVAWGLIKLGYELGQQGVEAVRKLVGKRKGLFRRE